MKGLTYVGIDPAVAGSPAVAGVARELGLSRYEVVGRLPMFFGAVASHQSDGAIADLADDLLDDWAGGVAGWGSAMKEHMLDDEGVLRDWYELNGRALANLAKDRTRQRHRRRGQSADTPETIPGTSTDSPPTVRGESTGYTGTHTHTIPEETTSPPHRANASEVDGLLHWVEREAPLFRDDFVATLRSLRHPESLAAEVSALAAGRHTPRGVPVPLPVIGQAIRDLRLNGRSFTAIGLRTFVAKLLVPQTTTRTPRPRPPALARTRTRVPEL